MAELGVVQVGVAAMVLGEGGACLWGKRQSGHGTGEWGLPGGKPDDGETPLDTARRELMEETGLGATGWRMLPDWEYTRWPDCHYVTLIAVCDWAGGKPVVCEPDKMTDWTWAPPWAAPEPMFGAARSLLPVLCRVAAAHAFAAGVDGRLYGVG